MLNSSTSFSMLWLWFLSIGTVVNCCLKVCPFVLGHFNDLLLMQTPFGYKRGCFIDQSWSYTSRSWLKEWNWGTSVYVFLMFRFNICRSFLADQPVNVRSLIQIYKIGFQWEVMESTVIEKTVRKLMLSEERKDVKKKVADMQHSIVSGVQIDGISHKNMKDC